MAIEHIANSSSRNTQERASGEPAKETDNDHGLDVLSHSTWDHPDHENREGHNVNVSSAVELGQRGQKQRTDA